MKRYEDFKMERAALNYSEKLAAEYDRYRRKRAYLSELQ